MDQLHPEVIITKHPMMKGEKTWDNLDYISFNYGNIVDATSRIHAFVWGEPFCEF